MGGFDAVLVGGVDFMRASAAAMAARSLVVLFLRLLRKSRPVRPAIISAATADPAPIPAFVAVVI